MLWTKPMWLIGAGMSLDSMRRGFVGGTGLALFVAKQFGLEEHGRATLDMLKHYLSLEGALLAAIPPPIWFLVWPFQDYHEASVTYKDIMEILIEKQKPSLGPNCPYYWKQWKED